MLAERGESLRFTRLNGKLKTKKSDNVCMRGMNCRFYETILSLLTFDPSKSTEAGYSTRTASLRSGALSPCRFFWAVNSRRTATIIERFDAVHSRRHAEGGEGRGQCLAVPVQASPGLAMVQTQFFSFRSLLLLPCSAGNRSCARLVGTRFTDRLRRISASIHNCKYSFRPTLLHTTTTGRVATPTSVVF